MFAAGAGADADALGEQGVGPPSAEGDDGEESGFGDTVDHEADLVEVGGDHDARLSLGIFGSGGEFAEHGAEAVGGQCPEWGHFPGEDGPGTVLVAWSTVSLGEIPKE